MNKPSKDVAVVAIVALTAGYVAGLLTAPKSGKESRQDLRNVSGKAMSDADRRIRVAHAELTQLLAAASDKAQVLSGKAKIELETLVGKTNIAKEQVLQAVSSFKQGDASEEDVEVAVAEAKESAEELKEFLDK